MLACCSACAGGQWRGVSRHACALSCAPRRHAKPPPAQHAARWRRRRAGARVVWRARSGRKHRRWRLTHLVGLVQRLQQLVQLLRAQLKGDLSQRVRAVGDGVRVWVCRQAASAQRVPATPTLRHAPRTNSCRRSSGEFTPKALELLTTCCTLQSKLNSDSGGSIRWPSLPRHRVVADEQHVWAQLINRIARKAYQHVRSRSLPSAPELHVQPPVWVEVEHPSRRNGGRGGQTGFHLGESIHRHPSRGCCEQQ